METYSGRQLGNYRIEKRLARGGFGEVYLAQHVLLPRLAAIKFLHASFSISEEQRREFLQEARLLESLKHAHILPLYDVGIEQEDFPPYLIAAYAPGGSLRERLRQHSDGFALEEALSILEQIGQALQHAHAQPQPVIHRDLKPENILFDDAGEALLADFGIAVVLDVEESQKVGTAGTLPYMAPEQFEGQASDKSDQYALGCLAYELVTGHKPIQAQNQEFVGWLFQHARTLPQPPSRWRAHVPLHIDLAILKALAKNPHERHADVEGFLRALRTAPHDPADYQALLTTWLRAAQNEQEQQQYELARARYSYAARIDPSVNRPFKEQDRDLLAKKHSPEALATRKRNREELVPPTPEAKPLRPAPPAPPALSPERVRALQQKAEGDMYARQRSYERAWMAYERARQSDAQIELDWSLFGETCQCLGHFEQALAAYRCALQQYPHHAATWLGLADVSHSLGMNVEALDAYRQAAYYDPNNAAAHVGQGTLHAEEGRYHKAFAAYEQALRCQPDFVAAHCAIGDAHYNRRAYRAALAAYEQALRSNPTCVNALYGQADTLLKLKREDEARVAYTLALQYDLSTGVDTLRQADALFLLARYSEALTIYRLVLQADPANPDLYERCGDSYRQLGQDREAEAAYRRADQLRGYV